MVDVNSGNNMYEVRHPNFSISNEVDDRSKTGSSIRVVTRRASSSLSKGWKGLFCIHFSGQASVASRLGLQEVGHAVVANRTAEGSIFRISVVFAEIKARI